MLILVIDTEGRSRPNEVAGILYNTTTHCIVQSHSTIVPHAYTTNMQRRDIDSKGFYKNRYTSSFATDKLVDAARPMIRLLSMCDMVVGHNIVQDRLKLNKVVCLKSIDKPWFCTFNRFRWPIPPLECKSLHNLCRLFQVPTLFCHTAFGDSFMLLQCLLAVPNFETQLLAYFKIWTRRMETCSIPLPNDPHWLI